MRIDILTLFPKMFAGPLAESIVKRAAERGLVEIKTHNLRNWAKDRRGTVDGRPYGGGAGMVLMCRPIFEAVAALGGKNKKSRVILLSPQGSVFSQTKAEKLAKLEHLILICGRYEGVDERVRRYLVDEEVSIGDYILTGGELPAMVVTEAVVRLLPGVLEKGEAVRCESFSLGERVKLLEYPQYTRPASFRGLEVPKVLLAGDHQAVEKWRREKAWEKTKKQRPDLLGEI